MLSDEERELIEKIQNGNKIGIYELIRTFKREGIENFITVRRKYIDIMINLIEKQSKEIEELNLENIELKQSKIVDKNSIPNQDNFYDCYNFIHKDKIKAKIEELKEVYEDNYIINILQSLLEKE